MQTGIQGTHGKVAGIVPRLANSRRGKIFLCNLEAALGVPLISSTDLSEALCDELDESVTLKDEDDLLGCLKKFLKGVASTRWLNRAEKGVPGEFSQEYLITVMRAEDFRYYRDSEHAASNHDYEIDLTRPGTTTRKFDPLATTLEYFWAAPATVISGTLNEKAAERLRDLLGLVHYGRNVPLIALILKPPSTHQWCRPTVIEASPNARFRQVHPQESEKRWGFTVDLEKLDSARIGESIAGVPEVVLKRVALGDCEGVEFITLGRTSTDRATAEADRRFLDHITCDREFELVYAALTAAISAALRS